MPAPPLAGPEPLGVLPYLSKPQHPHQVNQLWGINEKNLVQQLEDIGTQQTDASVQ